MWYYIIRGTRFGPVSQKEINKLINLKTIKKETTVWTKGMQDWLPAEKTTLVDAFDLLIKEEKENIEKKVENSWFYFSNDERYGPFERPGIVKLIQNGTITRETLLWNAKINGWIKAIKTDFSCHFDSLPPTPPSALVGSQTGNDTACPESRSRLCLFIKREQSMLSSTSVSIYVDGTAVGKLFWGKSVFFDVLPGKHVLTTKKFAAIGKYEHVITVEPGQTYYFRVKTNAAAVQASCFGLIGSIVHAARNSTKSGFFEILPISPYQAKSMLSSLKK